MAKKGQCTKFQGVAFMVLRPVSKLDAERWGIARLKELNIETHVLDLTHILNHEGAAQKILAAVDNPYENNNVEVVKSYAQLDSLIKKLSKNTLFIDYIHGVSPITMKTARVFRALKKNKAVYGFISDGALPVGSIVKSSNKLGSIRSLAITAIKKPSRLINFTIKEIIKILVKRRYLFPAPNIIFGGNSPILNKYMEERSLDKKILVPINSFDYSIYSEYLNSIDSSHLKLNGTCVFLDEALTHHSDFAILGIKPADGGVYYREMNRLFDHVEEKTGLKVVVAAHPRSNYDYFPSVFDGREVIKGCTIDLVAKSSMVIMHMSTAVSFAILFNKPIVVTKIPGANSEGGLNAQVKTMAESIGVSMLDIEEDLSTFNPCAIEINQNKYKDYLEKYLLNRNAENNLTWNILASRIGEISFDRC